MSINSFFKMFTPKDKVFFPLLKEASSSLIQLAELLHECVNAPKDQREAYFLEIAKLEAKIEALKQRINIELGQNFITPFDREDIFALIKAIDYVADYLNGAANRMKIYQVAKISKSIRKLTEVNLDACKLIGEAIEELNEMRNLGNINIICEKINKLEAKSDKIFDKAVQEIFENEMDAKNIIKYKEVLSTLESAADKCKSVAYVLEAIAVKHS
ncbi:DUF47 domain-containing protein [Flavobacterium sp. NKUCC04_CG]|uniref:DUF47 domain-containing protein n=1 Tax=Flavobacterium sp. NKUCC04_CG TaxID=2842121 RepID=UPI001C5B3DAA|nr:DUF47 family protein [Flavobacterium sp. NKUCC04_CG]MBW3519198.1 DUF47 family protein [Flavobacterium sp. NKUCC04_CG]